MQLTDITPLVLTYNEAPNIARSLARLHWAREVVVLDSHSSDETVALARQFANVRVVARTFDLLATQWNYGIQETSIQTEWVLALDADYLVTDEFLAEIQALPDVAEISAYRVPFVYVVYGRPLRGSCYGPVSVLFRRACCTVDQDGHAQRLRVVQGQTAALASRLLHDDRKPLGRWLMNQLGYMDQEAHKLLSSPRGQLNLADRLRLSLVAGPPLMLFYCLFAQRCLLDGWAGWCYALERTLAEILLSLKLLEHRLRPTDTRRSPSDNGPSTT